jgi:hypothetical protein
MKIHAFQNLTQKLLQLFIILLIKTKELHKIKGLKMMLIVILLLLKKRLLFFTAITSNLKKINQKYQKLLF